MLEGFDHDWTEALQRREAFYTNLLPAEYRFRVQAFDMNMPESVTEVAMAVEWRSHFYRNAWFFALCGGIVICGDWGHIGCVCARCTHVSAPCWRNATAWLAKCTIP